MMIVDSTQFETREALAKEIAKKAKDFIMAIQKVPEGTLPLFINPHDPRFSRTWFYHFNRDRYQGAFLQVVPDVALKLVRGKRYQATFPDGELVFESIRLSYKDGRKTWVYVLDGYIILALVPVFVSLMKKSEEVEKNDE